MNWLTAIVILILAGFAYRGLKKGFIYTVFSIASVILALIISSICTPIVSNALCENEKLVSYIAEKVGDVMPIESQEKSDTKNKKQNENEKNGTEKESDIIKNLPIPEKIKTSLIKNNTPESYKNIMAKSFSDYINRYIAVLILNAVSFFVIFILIRIILWIITVLLNLISRLPVINEINKTVGLAFGLLQGIILIWIGFIVLTAFSGTAIGQEFYECINGSMLLSALYNNNILMQLIMNIINGIFAL